MLTIFGIMCLTQTAAFAAGEVGYKIVDYNTGAVEVCGKAQSQPSDAFVGITVFNPGADIGNVNAAADIKYQSQTRLGADGYSIKMKIDATDEDKFYTLAASVDGKKYTMPLYFFGKAATDAYISELNALDYAAMTDAELSAECEKIMRYFSQNSSGIYEDYYDNLDNKAEIAKIFLKSADKKLAADEGYSSIKNLIDASIVCAAYNHSLTGGKLLHAELLGLDKDSYSVGLVKSGMTDAGVEALVKQMVGNTAVSDMGVTFARQAILAAVNYPTGYGYGHITDILSSGSAAATLKAAGFDSAVYNSSNKAEVAKVILNNNDEKVKTDFSAFVEFVNKTAKANPKPNGGGGGGGGGSSSGSSGKKGSTLPSVVPPVVNTGTTEVEYEEVFSDLADVEWAKRAIMSLYKSGIVSGMNGDIFAPRDHVTREQFVKMLVCAMNIEPVDEELAFDDVDKDMWYSGYVAAAVKNGIAFGKDETTFGIGELITREQIAAMCARIIGKTSDELTEDFADSDDISEYAKDGVMLMKKLGVIKGNESGEFKPKSYATRAEAAQIIYGIINL